MGRWIRESPAAIVPLALFVGSGTGLGAIAFRWLITAATRLFTGVSDYSAVGRVGNPYLPSLGVWFVLVVPVIAGAVYGPLVYRFAPEARGHGVPEVMYAVAERGGRIAPQVSVVKALASALCIGGGGSVGREGPIVQIGSALGSTVGRLTRLGTPRMRMLVACGASGGIAATFNAPLAGTFFAMELILRDFTAESFGAVVLSSVTASVVGRSVLGDHPFLTLPPFSVRHPAEYLLFLLLGAVVGAIGVCFSKVLYLIEDVCDWAWRGPEWLRPAVGGILLGALLLALPQMYGVGYPVLESAVEGHYMIGMLALLLVGKMVATSLTIGIGGSGGVFAPTLFIGAMAGTAFGDVVHDLLPSMTAAPGAYGLIGMGAALAGATRAPITAVVILFEITGEYTIILPLMAAVALAAGVSHLLSRDTIYTLKLLRRGVDIDRPRAGAALTGLTAGQISSPVPPPLPATTDMAHAAQALSHSPLGMLPVVDACGEYTGCVTARSVAEALSDPANDTATVGALAELPPTVTDDEHVADVLRRLADHPGTGLPVFDHDRTRLTGWISHEAVLAAIHPTDTH
ncbi:chloride channel protein [Tsukamurella soli]|uniref:Chloride channel protein n=1 Tax=Tsukamurella soli TaxID=644556 RepID=A0ABP8JBP3_9ACTN